MDYGTWDTLFNIVFVIFWFRIWMSEDRSLFFNPYLAPLVHLSDSALNFLRPVFFRTPPRMIAAVALSFLLVFRSMAFHGMAVLREASWVLRLGFERQCDTSGIVLSLVFSILSFAIFLFKLWGLSLIYVTTRHGSSRDHATDTLYHLSRPFSDLRTELRPLGLLSYGILLAFLLNLAGEITLARTTGQQTSFLIVILKYGISIIAGWVQVLPIVRSLMILLIIGSFVSMFTASQALMSFCREWIDLFLGPLRRYPIRIGMFDLTPIVFFIVIGYVYRILIVILFRSYTALT